MAQTITDFDVSLKIKNYRCFGDEPQGFDRVMPINVIVGRNNAGKSSLIDALRVAVEPTLELRGGQGQPKPTVRQSQPLTEAAINIAFPANKSGGRIKDNHRAFGQRFIGKRAEWSVEANRSEPTCEVEGTDEAASEFLHAVRKEPSAFAGRTVRTLLADRDVAPEIEDNSPSIAANGAGLTATMANFISRLNRRSETVEEDMLADLKRVYGPEGAFTAIRTQQHGDNKWEVILHEERKGAIALSQSGSGLKTVLLVLALIHLAPVLDGQDLGSYVFALEEIENNLHPAVQRRLCELLRDTCIRSGAVLAITTHSAAIIDAFAGDPEAQVLHVSHDGTNARVTTITSTADRRQILDDLDIRASDLLQANGIIWVEGPTERTYVRRWIDIFSNGELREGMHYQIVFYGGRLLSHLTADDGEDEEETADYLRILSVNRNVALLADSDKTATDSEINATKQRLVREVTSSGGLAWVTEGREIEHYLPAEAIAGVLGKESVSQVGQFAPFEDYLEDIEKGAGKRFERSKVQFADKAGPLLTRESLRGILDLEARVSELITRIRAWNGMPATSALPANAQE